MEQALIIGIVLVAIFMVMVFTNVPISVALGGSTIVTMLLFGVSIDSYADLMVSGMRKFSYLAIPFFILSGILMDRSGVAARIIRFAKACIGHITGGLAIMSIVVSVFWGAISGAGPATVAALGGVLIPSMDEEGYDKGFAAAVVAAAGGISIIIPPSITFVIYGVLANVSIGDLFIAGVIPGLFMGLCFCIYAYIYCRKHGYHGSAKVQKGEVWKTFKEAFLGILSPVIILGGIYGGIFTATEAGGIACVYALVVGVFIYKGIKTRKQAFDIFYETGYSIGTILMIFPMTLIFSRLLVMNGVPEMVTNFMMGISVNRYVILLLLDILLVLAGFFLDCNVLLLVLTPLLLPTATAIGLSQIHLATIIFVAIGLGGMTPPMATQLYIAVRICNSDLLKTCKALIPLFLFAALPVLLLVTYVPFLSEWLPSLLI